jgi:hypothetical protein
VAPTDAGSVNVTDAFPHRSIDLIIAPPRLAGSVGLSPKSLMRHNGQASIRDIGRASTLG